MSKRYNRRLFFILLLFAACLVIYVGRLANMQLVEGESYSQQADRKSLRTVSVSAPRGGIYDRNGVPLVINDMGYSIKIDKADMTNETNDLEVYRELLGILQENGFSYEDALPISGPPYAYDVTGEDDERGNARVAKLMKYLEHTETIPAAQAMEELVKKLKLSDCAFPDQRRLAGLVYDMKQQDFSVTNPFTVVSGVDIKTVTMVKERQVYLDGVVVEAEPIRTFVTQSAAHILGQIGSITPENYDDYIEAGYEPNEKVGRTGIENTMEEYLRGTPGERTINSNLKTGETSSAVTLEPTPGNNVYLTIDINLQRTLEYSLENTIKSIAERGTEGKRNGADANAGAAVMLDVNTGEVLAMASYPNYDPQEYQTSYSLLAANEEKPLFNRAIQGVYAPGSTFKIATALSALENGIVTVKDKVRDEGIYKYYDQYQPHCWVYDDYGRTHGSVDVAEAIRVSCNYYFYEVGRLTGIDKLNATCRALGLGGKSGIDLPSEDAGILAGPDYTDTIDQRWWAGDTLSAAIGQSYNQFTPIQLVNYIATIVNQGTHYKPQIVNKIMDYHNQTSVLNTTPEALGKIDISDVDYAALIKGMRSVTEDGTASNVFGNYDISVGGKTGTATVSSGTANGIFVAFAPVEDPQVAIVVVIEHGAHGNYAAPVAKDMLDAYFKGIYYDENGAKPEPEAPEDTETGAQPSETPESPEANPNEPSVPEVPEPDDPDPAEPPKPDPDEPPDQEDPVEQEPPDPQGTQ